MFSAQTYMVFRQIYVNIRIWDVNIEKCLSKKMELQQNELIKLYKTGLLMMTVKLQVHKVVKQDAHSTPVHLLL